MLMHQPISDDEKAFAKELHSLIAKYARSVEPLNLLALTSQAVGRLTYFIEGLDSFVITETILGNARRGNELAMMQFANRAAADEEGPTDGK